MTTVAPPPPPPPPVGNGTAAQLTVTVSQQAAAQLSKLAVDSLLSGMIKAPPLPQGETILQTTLGPIPFKAPFVLPDKAQAMFKVVQTEPSVQLQLTQVNGKAVPPNTPATRVNLLANQFMQAGTNTNPTAQLTTGQNPGIPVGNANAPATMLTLNSAQGLKAFVLPSTPTTAATPQAGTQPLQPGQTTLQTGQPTTATSQAAITATVAKPVVTGQLQGGQAQTQTNHFQPGNQLNVRLVTVQTPGQAVQTATPSSTALAPSTVITQGTVQGQTAAGQPVIKVPQGQIALDTQTKFPEGTQVKMEVLSSIKPSDKPVVSALAQNASQSQTLAQKWPALEEALATLRQTNPALADHLSNSIIPKPDTRLAMNMIFFLKALGRGTFKSWTDDQALKALARSKPELAKKLESDFSQLADKAKQANSTDWKIAYVPLQDQNKLQQIRIAQRDHKEEEKDGKEDPGVRFVIDINLSNLGPMQFDGLAKERSRRFDLIIRTHSALAGFMRRDIHDIYAHGMDVIGFDGKISFQVTPNFVQVEDNEMLGGSLNLGMLV